MTSQAAPFMVAQRCPRATFDLDCVVSLHDPPQAGGLTLAVPGAARGLTRMAFKSATMQIAGRAAYRIHTAHGWRGAPRATMLQQRGAGAARGRSSGRDAAPLDLLVASEGGMARLARALAADLRPGDAYLLYGDVGAGKSTFRCTPPRARGRCLRRSAPRRAVAQPCSRPAVWVGWSLRWGRPAPWRQAGTAHHSWRRAGRQPSAPPTPPPPAAPAAAAAEPSSAQPRVTPACRCRRPPSCCSSCTTTTQVISHGKGVPSGAFVDWRMASTTTLTCPPPRPATGPPTLPACLPCPPACFPAHLRARVLACPVPAPQCSHPFTPPAPPSPGPSPNLPPPLPHPTPPPW